MKKICALFVFSLCLLFSGFVLTACNGGAHTISFDMDSALVDVKVFANNVEVDKNDKGSFKVDDKANVRVKFYAQKYGVDFSDVEISVNGQNVTLKTFDSEYEALNQGNCYAGYILISQISKDTKIAVSGEGVLTSTFNFEAVGADDEEVKERLKSANIKVGAEELVDLYDFLQGGASYTREVDNSSGNENEYRNITLKFDKDNLYQISDSSIITICFDDGRSFSIASFASTGAGWRFNIGEIEFQSTYKIKIDLSKLTYSTYTFNLPQEEFAYSVSVDRDSIDYLNEGVVTLTKKLDGSQADYSNVKIFLDDVTLEKTGEEGNKIYFKIPAGITPNSGYVYTLAVQDIEFLQPTYVVSVVEAQEEEGQEEFLPFVEYSLFLADENGEKTSDLGKIGRWQFALNGQTIALKWSVKDDFPYDAYDYDICVNGQKLFNLRSTLSMATSEFTDLKSVVCGGDGYVLRATYDETAEAFTTFQVEIECASDTSFSFQNFQDLAGNA